MKLLNPARKQTSRQLDDLSKFLTLVGFIALLLGCIGICQLH